MTTVIREPGYAKHNNSMNNINNTTGITRWNEI